MKRWRLILVIAIVVVSCVSTALYVFLPREVSLGEESDWAKAGSVIVPYGVVREPYEMNSKNRYILYDDSGEMNGERRGDGSYAASAIPFNGGAILNFRNYADVVGVNPSRTEVESDYMNLAANSPSGDSAIFFYNDSSAAHFMYSFLQVSSDGATSRGSFQGAPEKIAYSESESIVYVRDEGDGTSEEAAGSEFYLLAIESNGDTHRLGFPKDYDAYAPYAPIGTFHYLGDGVFGLVSADTSDNQNYDTKLNRFRIIKDKSGWSTESLGVSEGFREVDINPVMSRTIKFGRVGTVHSDGTVSVYSYSDGTARITGSVSEELSVSNSTVGRVSSIRGDYFYIQNDRTISIREWDNPQTEISSVPFDPSGCGGSPWDGVTSGQCEVGTIAIVG